MTLPVVDPTNSCQVTETDAPVISTLIRGSQSLTSAPLKSNQPSGKLVNRPELEIQVGDHTFYALLDTGASVSAIAENTFNDLQHNLADGQSLNVLPVNGITVSTALRSRSKKVTSQVLLPFSVAKFDADGIFLVVPNLSTPFILGDDWLSRYKVILDYQTNIMVKFPSWNHECPFRSPLETDNSVMMSSLSISEHYETVYRSKFDQHMFSTQSVMNHIRPTNLLGVVINTMSSSAVILNQLIIYNGEYKVSHHYHFWRSRSYLTYYRNIARTLVTDQGATSYILVVSMSLEMSRSRSAHIQFPLLKGPQ